MTLPSLILCTAAALALGGMLCRLNELSWRHNAPSVVAMHVGLAMACVWALRDAYEGIVEPGSIGVVVAAIAWLVTSFSTWRHGPPAHTRR